MQLRMQPIRCVVSPASSACAESAGLRARADQQLKRAWRQVEQQIEQPNGILGDQMLLLIEEQREAAVWLQTAITAVEKVGVPDGLR